MEVYDALMDLKRKAGDLEDENRELREKLRFKSNDFEFRNPFFFEKSHPDRPLCPKCFTAKQIIAPVTEPKDTAAGIYRRCLACGATEKVGESRKPTAASGIYSGPDDWMKS